MDFNMVKNRFQKGVIMYQDIWQVFVITIPVVAAFSCIACDKNDVRQYAKYAAFGVAAYLCVSFLCLGVIFVVTSVTRG